MVDDQLSYAFPISDRRWITQLQFLGKFFDHCTVVSDVKEYKSQFSCESISHIDAWNPIGERNLLVLLGTHDSHLLVEQLKSIENRAPHGTRIVILTSKRCIATIREQARSTIIGIRGISKEHVLMVLRPSKVLESPSLSVIVPAKNEQGNIINLVRQLEVSPIVSEIIFVEGGSTDDTWNAIQELQQKSRSNLPILAFQQLGKGKRDAVELGVSKATKKLVAILDADLAVAPTELSRFYHAFCSGTCDLINGDRLSMQMEPNAMRPLNYVGNRVFASIISWLTGTRFNDCLCGTKLLAKVDFDRIQKWANLRVLHDPFGDFQLLLGASELYLGVHNISIKYRARTYGTTQIRRFRDGYLLARICIEFLASKIRKHDGY